MTKLDICELTVLPVSEESALDVPVPSAPAHAASVPRLDNGPVAVGHTTPDAGRSCQPPASTPVRPTPISGRGRATRRRSTANGPDQDLAAATAATANFIASVRRALQAPLAQLPASRRTSSAVSPVKSQRRSNRIANQPLNSSVRPSKRGEVVLMRKLGILADGDPVTNDAKTKLDKLFDKPLEKKQLDAIRDLFPVAQALSDEELSTAAMQIDVDAVAV